ncbi:type II secretion system F family protein [Ruminococcus gauvreauii]|uniref:Type II secretion system F family protein n=1 Tax=Ruminococcus gauvreauii TaxID=438033 RepID=A0ABY5VFI8_9FIRM|nr:type II secretion system F family protein [Ruminococcus gauvreauii]UWP59164.1 type II secretion system F family protein [Ruminococcus gauvreauii]
MAQYRYQAQTIDGKKIKGIMNAADEADLQLRLREDDAFLLSAKLVESGKRMQPFKPKVLADFSRQLGTLTASGVTLVRALNIIANGEAVKPKEKTIYEDMLRQLRQGIALSDAMESQNGAFPPLMVYMFRSAESSGNLDQVAMQMAVNYEKDHRLNTKISSSLVYPRILVVLIIGVILILTKFVLPQFQELFDQMEQLPVPTMILMAISDFMQKFWLLVIALLLGLWIGFKALLRIDRMRRRWHRMLIHMPLIGKLQKVICTSRFARTLSFLYTAGIPIVPSLQIARKTIGNDYIDAQFDDVIPLVRAGNNLSDGLDMVDGFVRKLADSIRVGEETGKLDTMLMSTAESMEYDADMAVTKMVSYVEPVMLIVLGIIVAFVMVAVFSALYGSYDAVAGM